ncbi:MAG: hypothetical protein AAF171_19395 [Cyanobacteria bacterium P01_A01_bin.116]
MTPRASDRTIAARKPEPSTLVAVQQNLTTWPKHYAKRTTMTAA